MRHISFFLSRKYERALSEIAGELNREELTAIYRFGQKYFPRYGREHWNSYRQLCADFKPDYPAQIQIKKLPDEMLGLFVPCGKDGKIGTIVLNEQNGEVMNLATLGHENAHMLAHFWRTEQSNEHDIPHEPRAFYAQQVDLFHSLHDAEEILTDALHTLANFPLNAFKRFFCTSQGRVRVWYRRSSVLLYLASIVYAFRHYPEWTRSFFSAPNKLFHICWGIHLIRLRVYLYENYQL